MLHFLLLCALAQTSPYDCRFTDGPIRIDGKLDDAAWKHAAPMGEFRRHWLGADAKPKAGGRVKLLWDRGYLYFAADFDDDDLFAPLTEHDSKTWYNDVFEMFVKPSREKSGYFEFHVTPRNTTMDLFIPDRSNWNFDVQVKKEKFAWETAVARRGTLEAGDRDEGWTVEGRIPWKDFAPTARRPEPGEVWSFAVCRYNYKHGGADPETSSTAKLTQNNFHRYEDFDGLRFTPPAESPGAKVHALPKPPPVTTSKVQGFPDPPLPFRAKRRWENLRPNFPIVARFEPNSDRLWYVDEPGGNYAPTRLFRVVPETGKPELLVDTKPFESTIYDICFHPRFGENGYVYLGLNEAVGADKKNLYTRIVRYRVDPKPPHKFDPQSRVVIIDWPSKGHAGGAVAFDANGLLYVTSGDGTTESDLDLVGQDLTRIQAKVLRIDVDRPEPGRMYSIPKDNPFVDFPNARGETWAYGLRNPWRISFDRESGQLWTAQNGQDQYEQVYLVKRGENYGWSIVEGNHEFYPLRKRGPTPIVPPAADHPHSEARSLTGGFVYRGQRFPELVGAYIYGDYSTGRVWAIRYDGKNFVDHREIARPRFQITAFFEDKDREICLCEHRGEGKGGFFTLERTPPETKPSTFPRKLSESGLFADVASHRMAPGVIPYSVNAPFWSDGAHKERWIAMPAGGKIGHTTNRGWNFPDGTTIVKSFAFDMASTGKRQWHETRFLVKEVGEWYGYSYRWNAAGTDADLVEAAGRDETFEIAEAGKTVKRAWRYPSRTECMMCHTRAHNFVLGLCDLQMNGPCQFGAERVNQLAAYEGWELFDGLEGGSKLLPTTPEARAKLVDPYDANQPLETRVRSFLHSNCANCHVKEGGGNARMELEFTTAADKVNIVGARAMHESFGMPNPTIVAAGEPEESLLLKRMSLRGRGQMPPIASSIPDERATKLLREWIAALPKAKK